MKRTLSVTCLLISCGGTAIPPKQQQPEGSKPEAEDNSYKGPMKAACQQRNSIAFEKGEAFAVGARPIALAAGDFNSDERADIVVANEFSNDVSLLLGKGDGTFAPATTYKACARPLAVLARDINGDNRVDVLVSCRDGMNLAVLLGIGDGNLGPAATYPVRSATRAVAVGKFDAEARPEIAVGTEKGIVLFRAAADGSLHEYGSLTSPGKLRVWSLIANDLDGDGFDDLVAGTQFSPEATGNLVVFRSRGDGTFLPATEYMVPASSGTVRAGDLNGDGRLDLSVTTPGFHSVLLGKGGGAFSEPKSVQSIDFFYAGSTALADLDCDGALDLAVIRESIVLALFHGKGDGTFSSETVSYFPTGGPWAVTAADLDGDQLDDLVVTDAIKTDNPDYTVTVFLNRSPK